MLKNFVNRVKRIELQEFSLSIGLVQGTFGIKESSNDKNKVITKQEVLKELFSIRNILSNFSIKFEVLYKRYENEFYDDEEALTNKVCSKLMPDVFRVSDTVSKALFSSNYFVLMRDEDRKQLIESFDYIVFEREMLDADIENYFLDPDEQEHIVTELIELYERITKQIELFIEDNDK